MIKRILNIFKRSNCINPLGTYSNGKVNVGSDNDIKNDLFNLGLPVIDYKFDYDEYLNYLKEAEYRDDYYRDNFLEKSVEHFISQDVLNIGGKDSYIDLASECSHFVSFIKNSCPDVNVWVQDYMLTEDISRRILGGECCIS